MSSTSGTVVGTTGAASGIGLATAGAFAATGAHVIVADIARDRGNRSEACAPAASAPTSSNSTSRPTPRSTHSRRRRSTSGDACSPMSRDMEKASRSWRNTSDFWDRVVDINLMGPVVDARPLEPMIARRSGKIVNVASDAGCNGSSGETVYSGLGRLLSPSRRDWRQMARYSINVNCVCPGTDGNGGMPMAPLENHPEAFRKAILFKRFGRPSEVADAIRFSSPAITPAITGQTLSVSGSLTTFLKFEMWGCGMRKSRRDLPITAIKWEVSGKCRDDRAQPA